MSIGERIVIVGAGPTGLKAAESYRGAGGRGHVRMLGASCDPPFQRPPLSKDYMRRETSREALAIRPRSFYEESGIELRTSTRVTGIDTAAGFVEDERGERHPFDRCLLATGARPVVPPVEGVDSPEVGTLREIADSERIRSWPPGRALVIGSGFIGCEVAASLSALGHDVTVATLEPVPQAERLGRAVGERIAGWLEEMGVELRAQAELQRIVSAERLTVELGAAAIEADIVVLALGIERNCELAGEAGLELNGDAIRTDSRLATSVDGILAAGDVAMADNAAAGRPLRVEHWGEALAQGEVAGATMAGAERHWGNAPGFWSTIGERTIKHVAWGDGFDKVAITDHDGGGFTAAYGLRGELVGVLTHNADEDYERGRELVEERAKWG